jgi:Sulfotransferase family
VGCPRSGTTLLQAMLGAHPEVASFPESHIFIKGRRRIARLAPGWVARRNLQNFAQLLGVGAKYRGMHVSIAPQYYQRKLISLLDECTRERKKCVWIEKTPNHVLAIPEIRKLVPSSRFIHLVRDGRAVVASLYDVTKKHPDLWGGSMTLEQCIFEWNRAILASSEAMEIGSDGIVVKYEALAANPEIETRRLCEFMRVRYEERMVTAYSGVTSSIVNSAETWKRGVSDSIHDSGLDKYFDLFSQYQRDFIERSLVTLPRWSS